MKISRMDIYFYSNKIIWALSILEKKLVLHIFFMQIMKPKVASK